MGVFPAGALAQLAAPTGLTVTPGNQSLTLSWDPHPAADTRTYFIHLTSAPKEGDDAVGDNGSVVEDLTKGWKSVADVLHPTTTTTLSGLTNGTAYRVRLRARIGDQVTPYAFATGTPFGPPTGLTLTSADPLTVRWTAAPGIDSEDSDHGYVVGLTSAPKTGDGSVADDAAQVGGEDFSKGWIDQSAVSGGTTR